MVNLMVSPGYMVGVCSTLGLRASTLLDSPGLTYGATQRGAGGPMDSLRLTLWFSRVYVDLPGLNHVMIRAMPPSEALGLTVLGSRC